LQTFSPIKKSPKLIKRSSFNKNKGEQSKFSLFLSPQKTKEELPSQILSIEKIPRQEKKLTKALTSESQILKPEHDFAKSIPLKKRPFLHDQETTPKANKKLNHLRQIIEEKLSDRIKQKTELPKDPLQKPIIRFLKIATHETQKKIDETNEENKINLSPVKKHSGTIQKVAFKLMHEVMDESDNSKIIVFL